MEIDDITAAEPPRRRWLLKTIAVVLPVALCIGGAALFIRNHVLPPTVAIGDRLSLASHPAAHGTPAEATRRHVPSAVIAAPSEPQTTGSATPANAPSAQDATARVASVWDSMPVPAPASPFPDLPAASAAPDPRPAIATPATTHSPLAEPVPMPRARPKIYSARVSGLIPLPPERPQR